VGDHVPEPVPVTETRGGEQPGEWHVSGEAAARSAQIAVMIAYIKDRYGTPEGNAE
jgi:hypothetical protein